MCCVVCWIRLTRETFKSCSYVDVNRVWDRVSKVLICLVDAGLNYYFLRIVKQRLLNQYGLLKYAPLVTFNARLMAISVLLDVSPLRNPGTVRL